MKISAKGRYALASMVYMAEQPSAQITLPALSEALGFSKVFLEQIFSLLKVAGLVTSVQGAQGGYQLAQPPEAIRAFDILSITEVTLFDKAGPTVDITSPELETALQLSLFRQLDAAVEEALKRITVADLAAETEKHRNYDGYMYYI